jgi:hypothetical protein
LETSPKVAPKPAQLDPLKPQVAPAKLEPAHTLASGQLEAMVKAEVAEIDRQRQAELAEKARLATLD